MNLYNMFNNQIIMLLTGLIVIAVGLSLYVYTKLNKLSNNVLQNTNTVGGLQQFLARLDKDNHHMTNDFGNDDVVNESYESDIDLDSEEEEEEEEEENNVQENNNSFEQVEKEVYNVNTNTLKSEPVLPSNTTPVKKRKLPNESAKDYKEGHTVVSENDGRTYEVFVTAKGVYRWKLLKNNPIVSNVIEETRSDSNSSELLESDVILQQTLDKMTS